MKVSVIIPTFNRKKYLKRALDSVLNQTYSDIEVVVVDDGSNDGTKEFLNSIEDSRVKPLFLDQNQGVSYARNRGFEKSSGEWIALLDSDDEWLTDKIDKQVRFVEAAPDTPLVHGDEIWIRRGKRVNQKNIHQKSGGDIFERALHLCLISPSACMIRRDIWQEFNGFREDFEVCEDYDLWLKLTSKYSIGFLNEPLIIKYGGHEDQLSSKFKAMDYWRVRSIDDLLKDGKLNQEQQVQAKTVLLKKAEILQKGYLKHNNLAHLDYVESLLKKYQE